MEWFEKPYRFRHCYVVIRLSVILFLFVSSRNARAIIYYVFRAKVSHKTICEWVQKFPAELPKSYFSYEKDAPLFLFVDEKYVWIKGELAYWWTIRDQFGNVLAKKITESRDLVSAKEIFRLARQKIDGEVTAIIHDGMKDYPKAVHWIFGRKCRSIVVGIHGKNVIINKELYWFNNNMSESINAQIDAYLSKYHYNFENIDSANRAAEMFLISRDLRAVCT